MRVGARADGGRHFRGERGSFSDFDYVALGHLHEAQTAGSERIRYSGSLLKYSFSDRIQQKSVNLVVDLGAGGEICIEQAVLPVRRDVLRVEARSPNS